MNLKTIIGTAAVALSASLACALPAHAAGVSGQGTWETTLLGRDINRNAVAATDASAVYLYDTALNVTWLRDADVSGAMDWDTATNWADNLNTGSGSNTISDWRLPTMAANPTIFHSYDGSTSQGYNVPTSSSEMASLFFKTLGNKSYHDTSDQFQPGYGLTNTGSFQHFYDFTYWLGTEYAPLPDNAWYFTTGFGYQAAYYKTSQFHAMAVRNGDVLLAPVPEPETYMMLLLGLGAIGALTRRRARGA